jgi:biopolymer transport protein TolQ
MVASTSMWTYIANASLIVKIVMLLLLAASVVSWTLILQRASVLKEAKRRLIQFENQFWSGTDLHKLYQGLEHQPGVTSGMAYIFKAGFDEFLRLRKQTGISVDSLMASVQRAMRIANMRETDRLEQHLAFLATVGSTSPYIGLFGTVWGIMNTLQAFAGVQQASIAMVAPSMSEALIATAMGLFAAIPAVIAYNRYSNQVERLLNQYDTFQEEFASILYRQSHQ